MISSTLIFKSQEFNDYIVYNDETHNEYLVTMDHKEGTVYCTCPDFKYRRDNLKYGGADLDDSEHHCKHIKLVLNGLYDARCDV